MLNEYTKLTSELRARAARLLDAAALIESEMGVSRTRAAKLKVVKRGKRENGSAAVVLDSIRDGFDKIATIAEDAKIKESAARSAILALEKAGKVKREGKGPSTRYVAA